MKTQNLFKIITSFLQTERIFLFIIGILFILSGTFYQMPDIARWLGFLIAAYAAVANDSIQTLGTFIASNRKQPWWLLWFFIGGIFVAIMTYSWINYGGDVSYGRLSAKGFETTPQSFSFLQLAAPIFLLILTRLKMPVSTTFLLLTSFSTSASSVMKVLNKSLTGYFLAFVIAFTLWMLVSQLIHKYADGTPHPLWRVLQGCSTGLLWSVWLMQDAANISVFLPRKLSFFEFICFLTPIVFGLGFLLKEGGAKIQQIVDEKSKVSDLRSATIMDVIYAIILFYFKIHSKIPMSTTWVFLGLLSGREIAMSIRKTSSRNIMGAIKMSAKDTGLALIGLVISFIIAILCNDAMSLSALAKW